MPSRPSRTELLATSTFPGVSGAVCSSRSATRRTSHAWSSTPRQARSPGPMASTWPPSRRTPKPDATPSAQRAPPTKTSQPPAATVRAMPWTPRVHKIAVSSGNRDGASRTRTGDSPGCDLGAGGTSRGDRRRQLGVFVLSKMACFPCVPVLYSPQLTTLHARPQSSRRSRQAPR